MKPASPHYPPLRRETQNQRFKQDSESDSLVTSIESSELENDEVGDLPNYSMSSKTNLATSP